MGCDIHLNVFVKRNHVWEFVNPPEEHWRGWAASTRNYLVFGFLTGGEVRTALDYVERKFPKPRGWDALPFNMAAYKHADVGDHSFSWLSYEDFREFAHEGGWDQLIVVEWSTNTSEEERRAAHFVFATVHDLWCVLRKLVEDEGAQDAMIVFSFDN